MCVCGCVGCVCVCEQCNIPAEYGIHDFCLKLPKIVFAIVFDDRNFFGRFSPAPPPTFNLLPTLMCIIDLKLETKRPFDETQGIVF